MRVTGRIAGALICAGLVQSATAGLDAALEVIDDGCRDRAANVVAEQWPEIRKGAEKRGLEVTPRHRAMHERVLRRRCELSDRIELVEGLREDLSEDEWEAFGGRKLLDDLREELRLLRN